MFIRFVCWLLKRKRLAKDDYALLTNALVEKLGALPTHAIITVVEGKTFIRGKELSGDLSLAIQEQASLALRNTALREVHEQVLYNAVSTGLLTSQNFDQTLFAKAAIWYGQEERKILHALANESATELLG